MKSLLDSIIAHKTPVFFLSPHLDDAALSCGGLIEHLANKTSVTVATIFTGTTTGPQTLSAKKSLSNSDYTSAKDYYQARIAEDRKAFSHVPVTLVHLGEVEALWRKKQHPSVTTKLLGKLLPEVLHLYPTYRYHIVSGRIAPGDKALLLRLQKTLTTLIPKHAIVFAPYGIGNHADHLVVRQAAEAITQPIYWTDQPYLVREDRQKSRFPGMTLHEYSFNQAKKDRIIQAYSSQMPLLFPNSPHPKVREFFLLPT